MSCGHSKLYIMDFANQPDRVVGCLWCELEAAKSKLGTAERKLGEALAALVSVCDSRGVGAAAPTWLVEYVSARFPK